MSSSDERDSRIGCGGVALDAVVPFGYFETDAANYIGLTCAGHVAGTMYEFAIIGPDGEYAGGCGLNRISMGVANLGYWIRSSLTGRGIAPAAGAPPRRLGVREDQSEPIGNRGSRRKRSEPARGGKGWRFSGRGAAEEDTREWRAGGCRA